MEPLIVWVKAQAMFEHTRTYSQLAVIPTTSFLFVSQTTTKICPSVSSFSMSVIYLVNSAHQQSHTYLFVMATSAVMFVSRPVGFCFGYQL